MTDKLDVKSIVSEILPPKAPQLHVAVPSCCPMIILDDVKLYVVAAVNTLFPLK